MTNPSEAQKPYSMQGIKTKFKKFLRYAAQLHVLCCKFYVTVTLYSVNCTVCEMVFS